MRLLRKTAVVAAHLPVKLKMFALLPSFSLLGVHMTAALSQGDTWPRLSVLMVREVPADMLEGFTVFEAHFDRDDASTQMWLGSPANAKATLSHSNQAVDDAQVVVCVASDPETVARGKVMWRRLCALPLVDGSYTGQSIGDWCMHGSGRTNESASLYIGRGNVGMRVTFGTKIPGRKEWSAEAERLAKILVARTDYALRWGRAEKDSISIGRRSMTVRNVPKAGYVGSATTLADRVGAIVSARKKGGLLDRIILTRGKMTVELIAGHRESVLLGKTTNLLFPSLVISRDDVVCLIEPVAKALGVDIGR